MMHIPRRALHISRRRLEWTEMTTPFDFPLLALIAFGIGFFGLAYGLPT